MIPYGVGTSLEGHVAALRGGVTLNLSRMQNVIEVRRCETFSALYVGVFCSSDCRHSSTTVSKATALH